MMRDGAWKSTTVLEGWKVTAIGYVMFCAMRMDQKLCPAPMTLRRQLGR